MLVKPFTIYGVEKLPSWLIPYIIPAPEEAIFYGKDSVCSKGIKPWEYAASNSIITIDHSAKAQ